MSTQRNSVEDFVLANKADLVALGLLFSRLLLADSLVLSEYPSPTFFYVMQMSYQRTLGMTKSVDDLITELHSTDVTILTDGFGGSILRMI